MKKRAGRWLCAAAAVLALAGCVRQPEPEPELPEPEEMGAWCVYWDVSAAAGAEKQNIRELVLFACLYREDGSIYVPPELEALRTALPRRKECRVYVSFVNDLWREDGSAEQKSPALLARLLESPASRERCAREMAALALEWGCGGIEVDFENMARGDGLWAPYVEFVKTAWAVASEAGLDCRVVLGSSFPTGEYPLPPGPEYSVMCYNLYGNHSGPGPKADMAFLRKVADRFAGVPNLRYALANGGFVWGKAGAERSLTTRQAELLAEERGATVTRDPGSGAMTFTYTEGGEKRTVWYADGRTLAMWRAELEQYTGKAPQTDLWRLE